MAKNNPFTPLFGQVPLCIAGRSAFLGEMRQALEEKPNSPNLSTLIVGPKGTGKTVLLSRIATIAEECGWIVAQVSACDGMLEDILQRAYEAGGHLLNQPSSSRLAGVEVGGILGATWESDRPPENWRTKMNRVFGQLAPQGIGLLITVDEVNSSCRELITLATAYQHFLSEGKRVSLVMAGLPGNISGLVNGKSTSFWRRARQQHLGRIPDDAIASAFQETLNLSETACANEALDLAVRKIDGFAYLLQLVGYWSYEDMVRRGDGELTAQNVRHGVTVAESDMRNSVLSSTFCDLSDGDVDFLVAMLQVTSPASMRDIAEKMGVTQGYASQYRLRLIAQGVIGPRGRGKLDFEIPFFRQYVQEMAGSMNWPNEILGGNVTEERWAEAKVFASEIMGDD